MTCFVTVSWDTSIFEERLFLNEHMEGSMNRSILILLITAFLFVAISLPQAIAEERVRFPEKILELPTANMHVQDGVPLGVIKKIALNKARELWGQVTPGEPLVLSDEDGNLAYYMCPFHIGPGPFPEYKEIMKGVKRGRSLVKAVQRGYAPPQSDHQKALKDARSRELGIGEYGTVYVAATYDRFPIPLVSHYLAPFYLKGDLAWQKAKETLGGNPRLNRIFFLGERGTFFEFESGENAVTVHAYSLKIEPVHRIQRTAP
jgi:hypothetical protein